MFAYAKTAMKGNPRWQRMICVGKMEGQDTFVLYSGSQIVLSRSIRRIAGEWKSHMKTTPRSVGFTVPGAFIASSAFFDEEVEAVKEKAREEDREEREMARMRGHDPMFN